MPPPLSPDECSAIFDTWIAATAHSILFTSLSKVSPHSPAQVLFNGVDPVLSPVEAPLFSLPSPPLSSQAVADDVRDTVRVVLGFRPARKRGFAAFHADLFSKGTVRSTFDVRLSGLRATCSALRAELDAAKARAAGAAAAARAGDAAAAGSLAGYAAAVASAEQSLAEATRTHQEVLAGGVPAMQDALWLLLEPEEKREVRGVGVAGTAAYR